MRQVLPKYFCRQTPPWYAIPLSLFDFLTGTLCQVACNTYAYQIVPSHLAGTAASMVAITQYMVGRSFGSFVGGQLIEHLSLTIPNLFFVQIGITCGGVAFMFVIYRIWGMKLEKDLVDSIKQEERKASHVDISQDLS